MNIILLLGVLVHSQSITVHFFYSPDCEHCMEILSKDIPVLQEKYDFQFNIYDINILENYELLETMEENVKEIGEDLPIVFVDDSVFYGPDAFREKCETTIKSLSSNVVPVIRDTTKTPIDSTLPEHGDINLYYFYQPGCKECSRIEILLTSLQSKWSHIKVYRYDMFEDESKIFFEALAEYMDIPPSKRLVSPTILISTDYLIKKEITSQRLIALIKKNSSGSLRLDTLDINHGEENIFRRFSQFSILGILFAGLLDGVNPCAFATLVFFVSYLVFIGRRRRDIILMAIFFIVAVFISYLAIGFGAYNLLRYLTEFALIARILFISFGILAIVLGILSLRDYFLARKGEINKMILQLPLTIKKRIHKEIKEKTAVGGIIFGSLIAGFFISFLEFACTGQVYLPTITFMISRGGLILKPLVALLAYNIMFITPLIVIAVLATLFTTEKVAKLLEKRIPTVKFITALLFFALGVVLIILS
jgi:cytochrome c biogenesis protein CcdA/thiol-disulfide isomerase/thioredoxin